MNTEGFYVVGDVIYPSDNAFATRGYRGMEDRLEAELEIAQDISGLETPNFIVYGGGKEIKEFCCRHQLVYIHDFMSAKKEGGSIKKVGRQHRNNDPAVSRRKPTPANYRHT